MVHRLVRDAELPGATIPAQTVVFRGDQTGEEWIGQSMTRVPDCGDYWTNARVRFDNATPAISNRMEIRILAPAPSANTCDYIPGSDWIGPYYGERLVPAAEGAGSAASSNGETGRQEDPSGG